MSLDTVSLNARGGNKLLATFNAKTRDYDITTTCVKCATAIKFSVSRKGLQQWQLGSLVQVAFPFLEAHHREMFVSGVCNDCFNNLFKK